MNQWTWVRAEWDRVVGFGLILLGAVFLFLGYQGVQESPFLAEGLAYIASGGLGGLFCMGVGVGLLLSADLHDEWHKLDRIEAAIRGEPLPESTAVLEAMAESGASGGAAAPSGPHPATTERVGTRPAGNGAMALSMDWGATHRVKAVGLLGFVLLLPLALSTAGWRRANTTADLNVATEGLALAVAGTVLALLAVAVYAFSLRARVMRREGRIFRDYLTTTGKAWWETGSTAEARPDVRDERVLVAEGLGRFHRAGCPALAGLAASPVDRRAVDPRLSACGICGAR
jgi:hypothetical protein